MSDAVYAELRFTQDGYRGKKADGLNRNIMIMQHLPFMRSSMKQSLSGVWNAYVMQTMKGLSTCTRIKKYGDKSDEIESHCTDTQSSILQL